MNDENSITKLEKAVIESLPRDIDPGFAQYWIDHPKNLHDVLEKALVYSDIPAHTEYPPIVVNYEMSLDDAIKDGKYKQSINYDLREALKKLVRARVGKAEVTMELVCPNPGRAYYYDTVPVVKQQLDELDLRPANLMELLAFGANFGGRIKSSLKSPFFIVALGSLLYEETPVFGRNYDIYAPYIHIEDGHCDRVGVHLISNIDWWSHCWRFLSIHKYT